MKFEEMTWESAYAILLDTKAPCDPETVCAAITRLGKPFDPIRVKTVAPLVAQWLADEDFLIRHQVVWFLGCWAKLQEYLPLVVKVAQSDTEADNRAFAARCVGQLLKSHHHAAATRAMLNIANADQEDPEVRSSAYSALLYAFFGANGTQQAREFEPMGGKNVQDFDPSWLATLPKWIESLPVAAT